MSPTVLRPDKLSTPEYQWLLRDTIQDQTWKDGKLPVTDAVQRSLRDALRLLRVTGDDETHFDGYGYECDDDCIMRAKHASLRLECGYVARLLFDGDNLQAAIHFADTMASTPYGADGLRHSLNTAPWRATSHYKPHEYVVSSKQPVLFIAARATMYFDERGYWHKEAKHWYRQIDLDGYTYWSCHAMNFVDYILNRRKIQV